MSLPFRDRHDAGRQLGESLLAHALPSTVVLGLPRGGVPVAYEIAHLLHAPLDIFLLRHLTLPAEPREQFGCVGSGGVRVVRQDRARRLGLGQKGIDEITQRERISLMARERTYRGQAVEPDLRGRTVILVDDGTAPVTELIEAAELVREHEPARIVVAVPVLPASAVPLLEAVADELVTIVTAEPVPAPERWYREFLPISHTEVRALIGLSAAEAQSRELAGIGDF
jgi:putative phosphoribosyl transferase